MAELKTKQTDASVEAFLDAIPDAHKRADCHALAQLMQEVTGEAPRMWGTSIVGFSSYEYTYAGFSPRAKNITLYVMSGFGSYDELMARLGKHKTGKSCLYINKLADVDRDVLRALIEASVAAMRARHGG